VDSSSSMNSSMDDNRMYLIGRGEARLYIEDKNGDGLMVSSLCG